MVLFFLLLAGVTRAAGVKFTDCERTSDFSIVRVSYQGRSVRPGEVVTLYGNLGPKYVKGSGSKIVALWKNDEWNRSAHEVEIV